jgi:hypothetical protein
MTEPELRELVAGLATQQAGTERTLYKVIGQVIRLSERLETPWDENPFEILQEAEEDLEFPWYRSLKDLIQRYFEANIATDGIERLDLGIRISGYGCSDSEVFAGQIEWNLRDEDVDRMLLLLRDFRKIFGESEHEGKKLYGILATHNISEDLRKRVLNEGIYLVNLHGGLFELQVHEGFQPRAY